MRRSVVICLFLALGPGLSYAQSSATIKMDHGEVTAGDRVTMAVTFDRPATCTQTVSIYLFGTSDSNGTPSLNFRGDVVDGKDTVTLSVTVPKDYHGEFHSLANNSFLFPCPGYSAGKPFMIPPVTLNVRGIPDPNKYPTKADVVLSLTQKQFLDTKVAELNDLSHQIDTRVERNGNDITELRTFLAGIVEKAEADLQVTERQYRTELLKPTDPLPSFFADFRRQYSDLHDELKAPIPGTSASVEQSPHLLYVHQTLKPRPPSQTPPRRGNLSGTSPAIARATKQSVDDNASAYGIVNSTGKPSRPEFHATIESLPTGATIYYRQAILPEFKVWPSKTDVPGVDFELATFVFKFHKDECEDEPVVTIDPYDDIHPDISVEFSQCRRK
jgi:hypothetical protein